MVDVMGLRSWAADLDGRIWYKYKYIDEVFGPGLPTLTTNHDANSHCSLVLSRSSLVSARLDAIGDVLKK